MKPSRTLAVIFGVRAFTLVELIVVITILAILGTIAFVSLQGYSANARDSVRTSDTKTFHKALQVYATKNNIYPLPDNYTQIYAGTEFLSYQGQLGSGVVLEVGQAEVPLDPVSNQAYIYAVNRAQSKIQLLPFYEKSFSQIPNVSGVDVHASLDSMFPKSVGDSVGVFLQSNKSAFQSGVVDIVVLGEDLYMYTPAKGEVFGSVSTLLEESPYVTCNSLLQAGLSQGSGEYKIIPSGDNWITVMCDMETDGGGWTEIPYSSDLELQQYFSGGDVRRFLPDDFELVFSDDVIQAIKSHSTEGRQQYVGTCRGVLHYKYDLRNSYDYAVNFKFYNSDSSSVSISGEYNENIQVEQDECSVNDMDHTLETIFTINDLRVPILNIKTRDNGDMSEMFGSPLTDNPAWLR